MPMIGGERAEQAWRERQRGRGWMTACLYGDASAPPPGPAVAAVEAAWRGDAAAPPPAPVPPRSTRTRRRRRRVPQLALL